MATGVLVLCVGQATRLSEYAMQSTKAYRAQIRLGSVTDTYDAEGRILRATDASHITQQDVERLLPRFQGHIEQVPPMYSAIKQDGKKLYELAREGKEVQREARSVTIHTLEVCGWDAPSFCLDITCSSGTYIRSLAYDIGEALGVGAHMSALTRTRSGNFSLSDALNLDTLLERTNWQEALIAPSEALADWQAVQLSDEQGAEIRHGRFIPNEPGLNDPFVMAYLPGGHLLAVLENRGRYWKPHKVFLPE